MIQYLLLTADRRTGNGYYKVVGITFRPQNQAWVRRVKLGDENLNAYSREGVKLSLVKLTEKFVLVEVKEEKEGVIS